MREKYIDELTGGVWFEFGSSAPGLVDVSNSTGDVFTSIPKDIADMVIFERNVFLNKLYEILKDTR